MTKKTNSKNNKAQSASKSSNVSSVIHSEKSKVLGKPDVEKGQKHKHIHEVTGIPPLDFNNVVVEDCEKESESEAGQSQDAARYQIYGKKIIQIIEEEPDLLQLTEEDVQFELDYWQQAVVGFVVGANPPWKILEGFLKRIWNKYVIDKISFLTNGVFLARFQTEEMKQAFLGSSHFLFDNKPLIFKPWQPDVELTKEDVKSVPAWIRLQNLPLKFWGKSLPKLAGLVGKYIKSDELTALKTRLRFARVMVELNLGQSFPKHIKFRDEKQQLITIDIAYEWKPSLCTKLRQFKDTRKGSENDSRTLHTYPFQMETLKGNFSPKKSTEFNGMNKEVRQKVVNKFLHTNNVGLFGLLETKVKSNNVHRIVNNIFSDWSVFTNNSKHPGGRAGTGERKSLWLNLRNIAHHSHGPWVIRGDFNCVLQANERLGGMVSNAEAKPFSDCLQDCGLVDIAATEGHFDHTPCLVSEGDKDGRQNRPFKYFNMWSSAPGFQKCVTKAWSTSVLGTKMYKVVRKLKLLKPALKMINRSHFSVIENSADIAHLRLTHIQEQLIDRPGDEGLIKQEQEAHQISLSLQTAKMEYLKQKTKAHWIKDGDFNYAYFHGCLSCSYHKGRGQRCNINIPDEKDTGPDGFSSKFFKDSWYIVVEEVTNVVLNFFESNMLLKQINTTMVGQHLTDLIAQNQGGFIQGRIILENILICQDIIRLYERQAVSPKCLLKMDLQKAYDTIEWDFLDQMLTALNFPIQFKGWIMQCVTTTSYSLNLNGNVFGFFKGQRGLRQGDPLSPLLFTICMEYLSRLLAHTIDNIEFRYHPLCKPMKLTHLMFADDLLLFCKGDAHFIMTLLRTFATFSSFTELHMSKGKSNAYFNGVNEELRQEIIQISGMVEGNPPL
ncbi:uncharacterized protein LOC141588632 [Silene latifolia]|uniref:uncharacterized protein LOC141588632 n=1 Tax=Silene latifolia TaxID=37657 RepID=UPI003D777B81